MGSSNWNSEPIAQSAQRRTMVARFRSQCATLKSGARSQGPGASKSAPTPDSRLPTPAFMIHNILICTTQVPFTTGGAESHIEGLRRALIEAGYKAEVVALP